MTVEQGRLTNRLLVGAGIALLTLGVRLVPAASLKTEIGDMSVYRQVADAVRRGDNVYAHRITFPYAPYSQFLPAAVAAVAERVGCPFPLLWKGFIALADSCTALLIFGFLLQRGVSVGLSSGWSLAWAVNPISILVSGFHGNVMPVVPLLALAAYVSAELSESGRDRDLLLAVSALLLGLAIAMRTYPLLLLPVFLLMVTRTAKEIGIFTFLAALPAGLSSLPYLLFDRETFLREALGYSGVVDFGWLSVLRAAAFLVAGHPYVETDTALVELTKGVFLGAYLLACLTLPFFRRSSFSRALMVAPLLFYGLYGGVSAQYLVWVLPFAACSRERLLFPFTVIGTLAMVAFYSIYHPGVLTGGLASPWNAQNRTVWIVYGAANVGLVVLSLAWAARIVGAEISSYRRLAREARVPWLEKARSLWSSRWYSAALLFLAAGWLGLVWLALLRARGFARLILR